MSPAASGWPAHTRATSVNGVAPNGATNGARLNDTSGQRGSNGEETRYRHLDDLVSAKPNVDIHSPIHKILQDGETLAKQATTLLDFGKPELALQEYVKASIVAVEIVPRHKDYPLLQSGRGTLYQQYNSLTKRINLEHSRFAEVKKTIQESNRKYGAIPGSARSTSTLPNGHQRAQSVQPLPTSGTTASTGIRTKPPIQPKPNALHGNTIQPLTQHAEQSELIARFARLRTMNATQPSQDPRIRTQSISVPQLSDSSSDAQTSSQYDISLRPSGPREMPSATTSVSRAAKPPLDTQIPGLPRPPDAIYNSPARNADNAAAANLPSSAARSASFSKQTTALPISTVGPTPGLSDYRKDYFDTAQPVRNPDSSTRSPRKNQSLDIPDSTSITAEDLMDYLKIGSHTSRVLLVDVRSREDFESGHIMSQSIICIEPIALCKDISAAELGDRMVIAPDTEQTLYDQRDDFDLVVFYDQSSSSFESTGASGSDDALHHFYKAVYDYGYEKRLRRRPMLLLGGLDAWIDLLGPNSLETSASRSSSSAPSGQASGRTVSSLARSRATRNPPSVPLKRRKTYTSRPLSKEEENQWDQALREDRTLRAPINGNDGAIDFVYTKTTEDFFRRYPEVSAIQESMISLPTPDAPPSPRFHDLASSVPAPPVRPPPALPRQRSSGLLDKGPTETFGRSHGYHLPSISETRNPRGLTGLSNPGVLCYMNSAIQALSSTPFLREFLLRFEYPPARPFPRKAGEITDPPLLMVRSLGNLFGHLWNGAYDFITPKTFARYVNNVDAGKVTDPKTRQRAYGGSELQHDSAEFMNFVLEILDDELNPLRDRLAPNTSNKEYEDAMNNLPILEASTLAWRTCLTSVEDSLITRKMKGQIVHITTCDACKGVQRTFQNFLYLQLPMKESRNAQSLQHMISTEWNSQTSIDNYSCERCHGVNITASRRDVFCKLPDYIVLQLGRYDDYGKKINDLLKFPEFGLDFGSAFLSDAELRGASDPQQRRPFKYDCYATICHIGYSIRSGHYYTYAKSLDKKSQPAGEWQKFNDGNVDKASFQQVHGDCTTILFLKRQGADLY